MQNLSRLLVIIALSVSILATTNAQPTSNSRTATAWHKAEGVNSSLRFPVMAVPQNVELPLIVADSIGEGGLVDIKELRGGTSGGSLMLRLVLATPLNTANFGGYLGLDVDQNSHTGLALSAGNGGQDVGCEYTFYLFALSSGSISMNDSLGVSVGTFPATSDSNSFSFSIPLTTLHDTDGKINVAAVVGTLSGPTDWIPQTGHGTALPFVGYPHLIVPDTIKFARTSSIGTADTLTVGLQNGGLGNLVVSGVSVDLPEFSIVGSTSFSIGSFSAKDLRVRFNATSPGTKNPTLTITSNDSASPAHVHLVTNADYAPAMAVTPDSFDVPLHEGDSTTRLMTIKNTGIGTLHWSADGSDIFQQMVFTLPSSTVSLPFAERRENSAARKGESSIPGTVRGVTATLADLSGKHVGFMNSSSYAVLKTDLQMRGATVVSVGLPINSATLQNLDVLVIDDLISIVSSSEIDLIRTWLQTGKGLLVQGDDLPSMSMINYLVAGTGISDVSFGTYFDAVLTNIVPHQITAGVDSVYAGAYGGHLTLSGDAQPLVYDTASHVHIGISHLGSGRVLVAGNEVCDDFSFVIGDARLLSNQAIDWLITGKNLLATVPGSGTVAPNDSQHVTVKIDAKNLPPGNFRYTVEVASNDPQNSLKVVPFRLHIAATPNLVVSDSFNTNSTTFVGVADTFVVPLKNSGSEHLIVLNITSSNPEFSVVGPTLFAVPSMTSKNLPIRFNPSSPGVKSATLSISSNDPDSMALVKIVGTAAHPPKIEVQPDSFSVTLNVGDSSTVQMTIDNSAGLGALTFKVGDREEIPLSGSVARSPGYSLARAEGKSYGVSKFLMSLSERMSAYRAPEAAIGYFSHSSTTGSTLPLLVQDPIGDGGTVDIAEIHGSSAGGNLQMSFVFSPSTKADSAFGVLALDIDQKRTTGQTDTATYHDVGIEYFIYFFKPLFGDSIVVFDNSFGIQKLFPLFIQNQEASFSVPLSLLGGDDGRMDFVAVSGNISILTDWAPDKGHATILPDVAWLASVPDSGTVPPGGSTQVSLKVKTKDMFGGKYKAVVTVSSNDPLKPRVEKPFRLTLTGIPKISLSKDSLNFGQVYNGFKKRLDLVITNTGTDLLTGTVQLQDSVFVALDSMYSLAPTMSTSIRIEFRPHVSGHSTKTFNILSNTTTSPLTVKLTGDALVAPNIKTSVISFTQPMKGSDTLKTSFKIYNTGEAPLTVKITDESVSGSGIGGGVIYAAQGSAIYVVDLKTKSITGSLPSPVVSQGPTGLAYSGKELFIEDVYSAPFIYVLDPSTGAVLRSFPVPTASIDGLAYVNDKLYALRYGTNSIFVLNPQNGALIDTLYAPSSIGGGMDGANGRLFVTSFSQMLYELDPENGSLIRAFSLQKQYYGVAFTGTRLFVSSGVIDSTAPGYVVELDPLTGAVVESFFIGASYALAGGGPGEAPWLTETPPDLTVQGKDSTVVQVTIIPKQLTIGQFKANIVLSSNDPDSAKATILVTLSVTSGVGREELLPTEFALYQNYPNPFNPTTTIRYALPFSAKVKLSIYDLLGRENATFVNEEQSAGWKEVLWNAASVASGTYFYRIEAVSTADPNSRFVQVKKMLLLK